MSCGPSIPKWTPDGNDQQPATRQHFPDRNLANAPGKPHQTPEQKPGKGSMRQAGPLVDNFIAWPEHEPAKHWQ